MHQHQKRFRVKIKDRFMREALLEIIGQPTAEAAGEFAKTTAIPGSEPKVISVEAVDPEPDDASPQPADVVRPATITPKPPVVATPVSKEPAIPPTPPIAATAPATLGGVP